MPNNGGGHQVLVHMILWGCMSPERAVASAGDMAPLFSSLRWDLPQPNAQVFAEAANACAQPRLHPTSWELEASQCRDMLSKPAVAAKPEMRRPESTSPKNVGFNRPRRFISHGSGTVVSPGPELRNSSLSTVRLGKWHDLLLRRHQPFAPSDNQTRSKGFLCAITG
jgi:hypothetical protein